MQDADTLCAAIRKKATALRSLGYRVRLDLTDTGESILLETDGTPEVGEGEADTTLRLSSDDLAKLIAGKLSPMLAFTTGRLKVDGSRGVAMKLAGLLDED